MKVFPASGWFAVFALDQQPYRKVVPVVFWVLDGERLRAVVPSSPAAAVDDPGPGFAWADQDGLVGFYHMEWTPKEQIRLLVEEALLIGARKASEVS